MTAEKARKITKRAIEKQTSEAEALALIHSIFECIEARCKEGKYTLTERFYVPNSVILSIVSNDLVGLGYDVVAMHSKGNVYEFRINWREV